MPQEPSLDDRPLVIDVAGLAAMLGLSPKTVQQDVYRRPDRLPPRLLVPGVRRILWLRKDVERWLEALPRTPANGVYGTAQSPAPQRRRGRPTKAEQLARRGRDTELGR